MNSIIVIIILSIVVVISLVLLIIYRHKYITARDSYYMEQYLSISNRSKVSMIEYQYKNFKEGQNAFTTLAKISNILKEYDTETEEE